MEKTKIIYTPNGTDDQDAEEVLLSDSEKFEIPSYLSRDGNTHKFFAV